MVKKLKVVAIVQARMDSTRFPNKILKKIGSYELIKFTLKRLSKSVHISQIILATAAHKDIDKLKNIAKKEKIKIEIGDKDNVLKRYYNAAKKNDAKVIVRITGDCPFIDIKLIDKNINFFINNNYDYISNTIEPTFPDGLDFEIFSYDSLKIAYKNARKKYDLEHVTPYIKNNNKFIIKSIKNKKDFSHIRLTVDEKVDLELLNLIYKNFQPNIHFTFQDIIKLYIKKPELFKINSHIIRDEGSRIGTNQKLWSRAKSVIPGGNMFLSKRPEMFLPGKWPTYFSKAKGCHVWDMEGKKYIDTCLMGVGTNILGYGNRDVDIAVKNVIKKGNLSSLNCPEEIYLSEKLIEMHPWSDMVKLARTGGEANAIAIRIARAYTQKEKIAVCGYHGWHDWYLSANLQNKNNLDNHLLKGLSTIGVPKKLKNSIFTFEYNNYDQLLKIVEKNDIGAIKMEVSRSYLPKKNFLKNIRKLCNEKNIILIFDECTSGFRETFGGLHKKFDISPDLATFGKALGNGYAITAVIGKKDIMQIAQNTFMSSTFWSERIGPVASLKTLEIMEKTNSWKDITNKGIWLRKKIQKIGKQNNLNISFLGLPSLTSFIIKSRRNLFPQYKTLISQEMLKEGYLASNSIYLSVCHDKKILNGYIKNLNNIFTKIIECENGKDVNELLKYPISHKTFERLN
mgnify:FL=1